MTGAEAESTSQAPADTPAAVAAMLDTNSCNSAAQLQLSVSTKARCTAEPFCTERVAGIQAVMVSPMQQVNARD